MAKLKLTIDHDVDFALYVEVELFGYNTQAKIALAKTSTRRSKLECDDHDVIDLQPDEFSSAKKHVRKLNGSEK